MTESAKRVLWRERVEAFERSGLQRGVWCARHGFSVATLDYWRQQLACEGASIEQRLIPIRVEAAVISFGEVKIELGFGVCLHAGTNVDAAWLASLLRGLR